MSRNLIITGKEVWNKIEKDFHQISCSRDFEQEERLENLEKEKYLILPKGLDALEKILKEEMKKYEWLKCVDAKDISSVFSRFKQEQRIK